MARPIRPLSAADAEAVGRLYAQSAAHLRSLGDETDFQFSAQVYLRDGFGPEPHFAGLGAVIDERLIGYLLYNFGYDTDRALRYLFIIDLLVDQEWRRQGIGTALMREAAAVCQAAGGRELFWAVFHQNRLALDFYHRLGAVAVSDLQYMRWPVT